MKLALSIAILTAGVADAASADLLKGLAADGVFRQVTPLPEGRLMRGERGYDLLPGQFGGHWSVVMGGAQFASSVRFAFLGTGQALENNGPTIAKLLGRMVGRAASSCFSLGSERLPELKSWLDLSLKAVPEKTLERSFGALKVQLLVHRQPDAAGAEGGGGHTEIDVLMRRSGTPGTAGWTNTCQK